MKRHTPHGPGFSFVDDYVFEGEAVIQATKRLDPGMSFFADHFPGDPLMPGVLLLEAAAQPGGILWVKRLKLAEEPLIRLVQVLRFKIEQPVYPGQQLQSRVTLVKDFGDLAQFDAEQLVEGQRVAGGSFVLGKATPPTKL